MIKCKNSCPIDKFEGCCFECDLKNFCIEICGMNPSKCGDSIMDEVDKSLCEICREDDLGKNNEHYKVI